MLHRVHHYNIIEELGKGGMGVVYKAEDTRLNRTVALKLLSRDSSGDPKARKRFLREARLASSLHDPNICTIHEIDETDEGDLYICMDYYEGSTLREIISRGDATLDLLLSYAGQIASGLASAHEKGIIHRDIKSSNIMITCDGLVKILDFGLAKIVDKDDSTTSGRALGSLSYISPEQASGKKVDHLTDIWSLGVVLYELVTGQLPFSHEFDAAVIYSILDTSPLPPSEIREDVPEELERVIYRCLRKKKEERLQSAVELMQELNRIRVSLKAVTGNRESAQSTSVPPFKHRVTDDPVKPKTSRLSEWKVQSSMVGREKEEDTLNYYLMRLIQGEGFIVNVTGEAGIGKSRLVAEFLQKKEVSRTLVLEGRAVSEGQNLSFHPLIELIRNLAEIDEADDEPKALIKLEKSIRKYCPGDADEVFPFIATMMGMSLEGSAKERILNVEGEGLEKLILKNFRTLISGAAYQHPLVILIEDLHWADQSTIGLLKSLYRLAQDHPILFLNVFRPGYEETSDRIRESIRDRYEKYQTEIILDRLDEQQSEILIRQLLRSAILPSGITSLIKQKVEGNPFFMEEVIRSMIEEGIIVQDGRQVIFTKKTVSLFIPGSIQELLISRIDKLEEDVRQLIRLAAVIGRQFFYKVLREVAGDQLVADRILDQLMQIQMIRKRIRLGEVEYLFKHALIQQAVYESLPPVTRKEIHLKVAASIEKVFPERIQEFYGILAFHYGQAEAMEKAENYLVLAGERALRSSASSEAIHYYKEALTIYQEKYGSSADPEKIATLNKNIGIAFYNLGYSIEAAEFLKNALSYYGKRIPKNPVMVLIKMIYGMVVLLFRIRFTAFLGRKTPTERDNEIHGLIFKLAMALSIIDAGMFMKVAIVYAPWYSRFRFKVPELLWVTAGIFTYGGLSFPISLRIVNYIDENCDPGEEKSRVLKGYARIMNDLLAGPWGVHPYDRDMVRSALNLGEIYNTNLYIAFKAHELLEMGKREAEHVLKELADLGEVYDTNYGRLAALTHGALCAYRFRELERAISLGEQAFQFIRGTLGNIPGQLMSYSLKAKAQVMRGELVEAEKTLQIASELAREDWQAPYFISYFRTASLLYTTKRFEHFLHSGKSEKLSALKKQLKKEKHRALRVSKKVAYEQVETYRLVGTAYWLSGKQGKAMKWWSRAMKRAEELNARLELSHTLQEVAGRLKEPVSKYGKMNGKDVDSLQQRADAMYKEMEIAIA
jgi:serine/threonine protein kinase/tetratricopeptide (TPR) repeat protein